MDDESGGILNISLSDSETEEQQTPAKPSDRTGQSEEEFQAVKRTYHVRIENGNVRSFYPVFLFSCSSWVGSYPSLH